MDERFEQAGEWEDEYFDRISLEEDCLENQVFRECEFHNCQFLSSRIHRCLFRSCAFQNCVFAGVEWKFTSMVDGIFKDSICVGIDWSLLKTKTRGNEPVYEAQNTFFKYCSFYQMGLKRFHFETCRFQESYFEECSMQECHLENISFDKTQFRGCDLRKADFRGAVGYVIDPQQNKLREARFSFPEVICLLDGLGISIE